MKWSILVLITLVMSTISQYILAYSYTICSNTTTTFTTGSTYDINLKSLFNSLSYNSTSPAQSGFYFAMAGQGTTTTVYGLFLCRGDKNATACHRCVVDAAVIKGECRHRKVAAIWLDECMVRYSNQPILGNMDENPSVSFINKRNINYGNKTQNQTRFGDLLWRNMKYVAVQAAKGDRTGKKYATKVVNMTSTRRVYMLAQCTPDLISSACKRCLSVAIGKLGRAVKYTHKQGASVLQPSCSVRYEIYPFFRVSFVSKLPITPCLPQMPSPSSPSPSSQFIVKSPLRVHPTVEQGGHSTRRMKAYQIALLVVIPISIATSILLFDNIWIYISKRMAMVTPDHEKTDEMATVESLQFDLDTICIATNNFSSDNKLGDGGFGQVYKGTLTSGQEIAVKRLASTSQQGIVEFKNEVVLLAKVQHKNLVKLLGFCATPNEKILVYEFLSNLSLNHFLFDPAKNALLDWQTRFKIIVGIAQGLFYLHGGSQHRIVHRDLKSNNILLNEAMEPKISDFGLATLCEAGQTQCDTRRIVGTYGYMAPEYTMTGTYSSKLDVYSFGVLVLEIVTGQKSKLSSRIQVEETLLHRAWRLWNEEKPLDLVDPALGNIFSVEEVTKCIHIGLLCIQEDADQRPRMASIIAAIDQSFSLPQPTLPKCFARLTCIDDHDQTLDHHNSLYQHTGAKTVTYLYPRD